MADQIPPLPDDAHALIAQATLDEWLTIRQIATALAVSPKQVRKYVHAGQFDEIAVFSRRLIRISKPSYDRFVAKNRKVSA